VDGVSKEIKALISSTDKALKSAVQAQFQISGYLKYLAYGLFKMPSGLGQYHKVIHIAHIDQSFVLSHYLI